MLTLTVKTSVVVLSGSCSLCNVLGAELEAFHPLHLLNTSLYSVYSDSIMEACISD